VRQELISNPYHFLTFVGSELNHAPIASWVFTGVPKIQQSVRVADSE